MGHVARNYLVAIPGAVGTRAVKEAANSRLFRSMRKALPSILIGVAAAALVRYIAESRLLDESRPEEGKRHSKKPLMKGEPATNGHQQINPDRLASFSEGPF
jgi:hypothetical protein